MTTLARIALATSAALAWTGLASAAVGSDTFVPTVDFSVAAQDAAEAGGTATVTLVLSEIHTADVTVPFTLSGTAMVVDDYTSDPSPAVITAGDLTVDVTVMLVSDLLHEGDETAVFTMGTPIEATAGTVTVHTLTITDDDAQPTVAFAAAAMNAGEGTGSAALSVQLSAASGLPVSVPFSARGSATSGVDYTIAASPLLIPAGDLAADVQVTLIDDALDEAGETVIVTLATPSGATLGAPAVHTLTIDDDDPLPEIQFTLASQSALESAGSVMIDVQLSAVSGRRVSAPFTVMGTATGGFDYSISASPVVLPAGTSATSLVVSLLDDVLDELPETVVVTLGTPTSAVLGATSVHTLTIDDDDPEPSVAFRYRRAQVDESAGTFEVLFALSAPSGRDVSVPFLTTGTASVPADYTHPASPLVISAGQQSASLVLDLVDDADDEINELAVFDFDLATGLQGATPGAVTTTRLLLIDDDEVTYEPTVAGLRPDVLSLAFATTRVGGTTATQTVMLSNTTNVPITLEDVVFAGTDPLDFGVSFPGPLPLVLDPGDSTSFDVDFAPLDGGVREAEALVVQSPAGAPETRVSLSATAYGPTGAEIRMNAGPSPYLDLAQTLWSAGYGSFGSSSFLFYQGEIQGTSDDPLFQVSRWGTNFGYSFELPDGQYDVVLHMVEPVMTQALWRVFDVVAEGQVVLDDLDLFATAGVRTAWTSEPIRVDVQDGFLDLGFVASASQAILSAIQVNSVPVVTVLETQLDFGNVEQGSFLSQAINLQNTGHHTGRVSGITWVLDGTSTGTGTDFYVEVDGTRYYGGVSSVSHAVSLPLPGMQTTSMAVVFEPTEHAEHELVLRIELETGETFDVGISGTGGADVGWGFLHPVLNQVPALVIDYDSDGFEDVQLLGAESHTHEPGRAIVSWEWTQGGMVFSTAEDPVRSFAVGQTTIELEIADDSVPPATAMDDLTISVYPPDAVPGILTSYYEDEGQGTVALLDNVPASADFIERIGSLLVPELEGFIGGSPYTGGVMVRMQADFEVTQPQDMQFLASGGIDFRLEVDGQRHSAAQQLAIGTHSLEARFAVDDLDDLPLLLRVFINGQEVMGYGAGLKHTVIGVVPVIHQMPTVGIDLGGNLITINGFGFYPRDDVIVHWGADPGDPNFTYQGGDFLSWSGDRIELLSPPGTGTVEVSIETSAGTSEPRLFQYSPTGPVPVNWTRLTDVNVSDPTTAEWGPDGRLYVGQITGEITAFTFDGDYNVTATANYVGISNLSNFDICGLTFNPFSSEVEIYVAHGEHFLNGGGSFTGPSPFTGQVSVLRGPTFVYDPMTSPLITQLPTSNHDHGVNGIVFDDNGDLLICMGGNTNAGLRWPLIGDVPESPLSGAVLKAHTSRNDFNGQILYEATTTGVPVNDQVLGKHIDVIDGVHVFVHAPGMRNAFDLVYTTWRGLYATDNGPNNNYGPASTGATSNSGSMHPQTPDELILVERGNYYGHPNRNRGRTDDRQNVYRDTYVGSEPGVFTQHVSLMSSSTDGLCEYRSAAFNSQIRGYLVAQKWNGAPRLVELSPDRRKVQSVTQLGAPTIEGLGLTTGPGGALIATNYTDDRLEILLPNDVGAVGLTAYDITPWRAPSTGGQPFVIGGEGFGNLTNTSVFIGGQQATLTSISPRRIVGVVPPSVAGATDLLEVSVHVGLDISILPAAFRYLPSQPGQALGQWTTAASLPTPLAEVSAGVIGQKLYVVGQGSGLTYAYDLFNNFWTSNLAIRPFLGDHGASEVFQGKLYVIGGIGASAGKVQVYDPVADVWTLGAGMPWNGGSCASAVIGDKIWVSGGIAGGGTVGNLAAYDPALNVWTTSGGMGNYPPMPVPVNHAASATDGARFFVFGGRQGGNFPQPGFTVVQVYDPATNTWNASGIGGSTLTPMPAGRGGAGKAVYSFGEFHVLGGESNTQVFDDVFVYDPLANSWRSEAPLPTARHGHFPVLFQGRIFLAGGGTNQGASSSDIVEVFTRQ